MRPCDVGHTATGPLTADNSPDAGRWPPPPNPSTIWRTWWVGPYGRREKVRCRPTPLWGREVLVDEAGLVYCHGCAEFVGVADLARPDNGHPVGLPFRLDGRLIPAPDVDDAPPRSELGW